MTLRSEIGECAAALAGSGMSSGRTREGGVPMRERSSQFIARAVIFASDRAAGLGKLDLCVAIRASLRSMVAARKSGSSGEQRSGRFSRQQSREIAPNSTRVGGSRQPGHLRQSTHESPWRMMHKIFPSGRHSDEKPSPETGDRSTTQWKVISGAEQRGRRPLSVKRHDATDKQEATCEARRGA